MAKVISPASPLEGRIRTARGPPCRINRSMPSTGQFDFEASKTRRAKHGKPVQSNGGQLDLSVCGFGDAVRDQRDSPPQGHNGMETLGRRTAIKPWMLALGATTCELMRTPPDFLTKSS